MPGLFIRMINVACQLPKGLEMPYFIGFCRVFGILFLLLQLFFGFFFFNYSVLLDLPREAVLCTKQRISMGWGNSGKAVPSCLN